MKESEYATRRSAIFKLMVLKPAVRKPLDAYDTPRGLAVAICNSLARHQLHPKRILEPSAGRGSFVKAAKLVWPDTNILAVDLNKECSKPCYDAGATRFVESDFLKLNKQEFSAVDLVLGNPPYTLAAEFVKHAYLGLKPGASVIFLLRLSFLASNDRWSTLYKAMPLWSVWPVTPRPSFTNDGNTDMTEYGVFRWIVGQPGQFDVVKWIA